MPRSALIAAIALLLSGTATLWRGGPHPASEEALSLQSTRLILEGDSAGAVTAAQRALALSPASAYRWADLAEALLDAGDAPRATHCFRRAVELAPTTPPVLLRAMYGASRRGESSEMAALGRRVLDLVPTFDDVVYGVYLNSPLPIDQLFATAIPPRAAPGIFLRLLETAPLDDPRLTQAWTCLRQQNQTTTAMAAAYVNSLWKAEQFTTARQIWAGHHGGWGSPSGELLWDTGFEHALAGEPGAKSKFDWQLHTPAHAAAARDCDSQAQPCALRLEFSQAANLLFEHIEQAVPVVEPGRYRLTARIKTENLTTEEGFGIRALGDHLDARSARIHGTSAGWQTVTVEFNTAPGKPAIVRVQIFRLPSWKPDAELNGAVWIDSVSLRRLI